MFFLNVILIPKMLLVLAKEIYECWLVAKDISCKHGKFIHTYFIVSGGVGWGWGGGLLEV